MSETNQSIPSKFTQSIGYAGLIPFIGLSILSVLSFENLDDFYRTSLIAYGATIISFLGAIHWGLCMRESVQTRILLLWGVTPSLIAWISLLLDTSYALAIQSLSLWMCLLVDFKLYPLYGLANWLRFRLTLTVISSICVTIPLAIN